MTSRHAVLALAALALAPACSRRGEEDPTVDASTPVADAVVAIDAREFPDVWVPDSGPSLADVRIFSHSPNTLFAFSPFTNTVTVIGEFTNVVASGDSPDMLDLAVDSDGHIFTASASSLWSVDPTTARITEVGEFDVTGSERFYALTFLTRGELYADREALIGATNQGVYYEIDTRDASTRELGQYPNDWLSSGDLVSIEGLGTYATIRKDGDTHDTLALIEFTASGASAITVIGPIVNGSTEYNQIFGLGYWGRSVYGFSNSGELIAIDRTTGRGTLATTATGTDRFWGAGVTTVAPVLE